MTSFRSVPEHGLIPEIIEHLEVPEGRLVQGHDMTFHAPVYGELVSTGGKVCFESSFGWGKVVNPAGHILGSKRAFNATLQAPGGVVHLDTAENCLIIGREVRLREAIKCQIFAHTLHLGTAAGCLIAGRTLHIQQAKDYKSEPTLITLVPPEPDELDERGEVPADCRCTIDTVAGETIVRQLLEAHGGPDLSLIPLPMIPKILFRNDGSLKFLFALQEGSVDWPGA
jgi:hypothetical protein